MADGSDQDLFLTIIYIYIYYYIYIYTYILYIYTSSSIYIVFLGGLHASRKKFMEGTHPLLRVFQHLFPVLPYQHAYRRRRLENLVRRPCFDSNHCLFPYSQFCPCRIHRFHSLASQFGLLRVDSVSNLSSLSNLGAGND